MLMGGKQPEPTPPILEPTPRSVQHEKQQRDTGKVNTKERHTLRHEPLTRVTEKVGAPKPASPSYLKEDCFYGVLSANGGAHEKEIRPIRGLSHKRAQRCAGGRKDVNLCKRAGIL